MFSKTVTRQVRAPRRGALLAAPLEHEPTSASSPSSFSPTSAASAASGHSAAALSLALPVLALLAAPDASWASAAEYPWATPAKLVLDPLLNLGQFVMLLRVIISWYPEAKLSEFPYTIIAVPTEPVLRVTRALVPPAFGVDVSPIVWIAILSFIREILFGQQGLVNLVLSS